MTHEYVIASGGRVIGAATAAHDMASPDAPAPAPTAIAWAADRVLAVGSDDDVRTIPRGDSTFIDLRGYAVTPADSGEVLEPGSPADLACWRGEPGVGEPVATVRSGAFTEGDEHRGPFPPWPVPGQPTTDGGGHG